MNKIDEFWNWIKENHSSLSQIEDLDEINKDVLLNELLIKLHNYCDKLFFEIGSDPNSENMELIITPEGDQKYFNHVYNLIKNAPKIKNWEFIALKPPMGVNFETNFEGIYLNPKVTWFLPLENQANPMSVGIRICINGYESLKNNKWLNSAVIKMIETVIGEKSYCEDIQFMDIANIPDSPEEKGLIELKGLTDYINWKKRSLNIN